MGRLASRAEISADIEVIICEFKSDTLVRARAQEIELSKKKAEIAVRYMPGHKKLLCQCQRDLHQPKSCVLLRCTEKISIYVETKTSQLFEYL